MMDPDINKSCAKHELSLALYQGFLYGTLI